MRIVDTVESLLEEVLIGNNMPPKKKKNADKKGPKGQQLKQSGAKVEDLEAITAEKEHPDLPSEKCRHLKSGLNVGAVRKKLKSLNSLQCEDCLKASKSAEPLDNIDDEDSTLFCCLACGHIGCGRSTTNQHALKHFQKSRSGPHCIVLNLQTSALWCYSCDGEIPIALLPQTKDVIDMIKNHKSSFSVGNGSIDVTAAEKVEDDSKLRPKRTSQHLNVTGTAASSEIKGLSNLGNTCFFNAVMQNMAQTHALKLILEDRKIAKGAQIRIYPNLTAEKEASSLPPLELTLDIDFGTLTAALRAFLTSFRTDSSVIVNPSSLFQQVCKKAPRFRGYQQQDSHELLRYLLDALRLEESNRLRTAICHHFGIDPDNRTPDNVDPKLKKKLRAYGNRNDTTFIEHIFGGQLLQSIKCLKCKNVTHRYEHFLDLSLSIYDTKDVPKRSINTGLANEDTNLTVLESKKKKDPEPTASKHQQKKAKQKTRKSAKGQGKHRNSNAQLLATDDQDSQTNGDSVPSEKEEIVELTDTFAMKLDLNDVAEGNLCINAAQENSNVQDEDNATTGDAANAPEENSSIQNEDNAATGDAAINAHNDDQTEVSVMSNDDCNVDIVTNVENGLCDNLNSEFQKSDSGVESMPSDTSDRFDSTCTLKNCLLHFTAVEFLSDKNKFGCENCGRLASSSNSLSDHSSELPVCNGDSTNSGDGDSTNKRGKKDPQPVVYTDAEKRYLISSPPAVLTLHLKRFHQVGHTMRKINKRVQFPLVLDIGQYCCKSRQKCDPSQRKILYSLYGVVSHSGSLSGGHYVAYVKVRPVDEQLARRFIQTSDQSDVPSQGNNDIGNGDKSNTGQDQINGFELGTERLENDGPSEGSNDSNGVRTVPGKWYYVSDAYVSEVTESKVLSSEAYILFYERIF